MNGLLLTQPGDDMKEDEPIVLTTGSKYLVKSLESKEQPLITQGTFKGYAAIGPDEAICMQLDDSAGDLKGKIRLIPCHMVISIDIISIAKEEKKKIKSADTVVTSYG